MVGTALLAAAVFVLPSNTHCVNHQTLRVGVREGAWTDIVVKVDGKAVKKVAKASGRRTFKVRSLPLQPFTLTISARGEQGRATASERYVPCPAGKPTVTIPAGDPPKELVKRDLIAGRGPKARDGHNVSVQYVGVAWSDHREFDSSWDRHEAFEFPLGQGQVIEGFDDGIKGMRVGGRRELTIPPKLGYGDDGAGGAGGAIKPGETLVFVVDLVAVD